MNSTQSEQTTSVQTVCSDDWKHERSNKTKTDMITTAHTMVVDVDVRGTKESGSRGTVTIKDGGGYLKPYVQEKPSLIMRKGEGHTTPSTHDRWSNPTHVQAWASNHHTFRRPLSDYHVHSQSITSDGTPGKEGMINGYTRTNVSNGQAMVRSITTVDLRANNRSTSFGKFDSIRHQNSPAGLEENGTTLVEGEPERREKQHGLGKRMKAIALTMRRGKKPIKSLSEDMVDDTDREAEGDTERSSPAQNSNPTSNPVESSSSSSSGMTSSSDMSKNRDSLRLGEDVPYTGQFCGRARVHTDFVPSPYDTDSLKLKVGDIINIISKPPMGIWTGMLNNKVGNFKFIYVEMLVEKEEEVSTIRPQTLSKRPRPRSLLELLEKLHLKEHASTLLLNGYQTVDDLKHLKEKDLIELNVTDPEHRCKLLAASEVIYDMAREDLEDMKGDEDDDEANDCPRDSGCFIPADCAETSKEDAEIH